MQSALALEVPTETTSVFGALDYDQKIVRKALDDLISRALAYRTGPELKDLFDFMRRFPHIAPYNAMLLHLQNPRIQFALRASMWKRRYERRVRVGARPYVILQPFGPVAFLFDLSDTTPINPKRDLIPELVTNPFPAKGQPPPGALQRLINACRTIGIFVEERDFAATLAGNVVCIGHSAFGITLNSNHTDAQRIGTIAHELAHVFCGHLGTREHGFWPDRRHQPRCRDLSVHLSVPCEPGDEGNVDGHRLADPATCPNATDPSAPWPAGCTARIAIARTERQEDIPKEGLVFLGLLNERVSAGRGGVGGGI